MRSIRSHSSLEGWSSSLMLFEASWGVMLEVKVPYILDRRLTPAYSPIPYHVSGSSIDFNFTVVSGASD